MASYISSDDVTAAIPAKVQLQALDDDADGTADSGLLDDILDAASRWVDGLLRQTADLSSPYPRLAVEAAKARACWLVFRRAGNKGDENPWQDEMERFQDLLEDVARGQTSLSGLPGAAGMAGNVADPEDDDDDPSVFVDPEGI